MRSPSKVTKGEPSFNMISVRGVPGLTTSSRSRRPTGGELVAQAVSAATMATTKEARKDTMSISTNFGFRLGDVRADRMPCVNLPSVALTFVCLVVRLQPGATVAPGKS
jgi:hypothetical protein